MSSEHLRLVLGLKLRHRRVDKALSLQDLSKQVGLSVSYLNEIENGKKYPKPERIQRLSETLDLSYDELVSQRLTGELQYLESLIDSSGLKKFPFHLFGISLQEVVGLVPNAPKEGRALVKALFEVARGYGMRVEDFFHTALRCYQEMNQNYFDEIESEVDQFRKESGWNTGDLVDKDMLYEVLQTRFGFNIDEDALSNSTYLTDLRSVSTPGPKPIFYINSKFSDIQKAFVVGREIGFQVLGLKERGHCSPDIEVTSFEQVLNAFKASYFASALFMNRSQMRQDLKEFFSSKDWQPNAFLELLGRYYVTSEMFFYRLSEIIPQYFGVSKLHFLRFDKHESSSHYQLVKQLNMSQVKIPTGVALNEHFCRRWLSIRIINELAERQKKESLQQIVQAQRSVFVGEEREFFCIALARPLVLNPGTLSSVTLGFEVNAALKRTIKFWKDPKVDDMRTNETCERCELPSDECSDRTAEPVIYQIDRKRELQREELLSNFLEPGTSSGAAKGE